MKRYEALVIGGGPAGSTAALALARAGWSVGLVEKAAFPRRKVCGEYISATTWPVLRELGVADELASQAGPPVRRVGFFTGDAMVEAPMPHGGGEWGRAIGRDLLDAALLDRARAAGVQVLQPCTVSAVTRTDEGFAASLQEAGHGEASEARARIVIDAHGSWERGVAMATSRSSAQDADLLGFKAHFRDARLATGLMPLVLFPGGYGGLVHSDSGRVSFSCCIRRDALARARAQAPRLAAGEAVLAHAMAACRGLREALSAATRDGPWLAAGPIRPGLQKFNHPVTYHRAPLPVPVRWVYVLANHLKHGVVDVGLVDPMSSAPWLRGWMHKPDPPADPSPVAAPKTWLLERGWHGDIEFIHVGEVPRDPPS